MRAQHRFRRPVAALALAVAASLLLPLAPAAAQRRVLWGAYVNPEGRWESIKSAMQDVQSFERMTRRKLAIDHHFYGWRQSWPTRLERWDRRHGRIPMVTWEPEGVSFKRLIRGGYDRLIRRRAIAVRDFRSKIFVRWGHEMNGDWYDWGNKPTLFIQAWRRIHRIFRANGARNAIFVWAPNSESVPGGRRNHPRRYYPGDRFVDWVGVSGFNWGTTRDWSRWRGFRTIFEDMYRSFRGKPFMITETASVESGGNKAGWIRNARRLMKNRWPRVRAFVWFNVGPWRVNTSGSSLRVVRGMVRDRYFSRRGTV